MGGVVVLCYFLFIYEFSLHLSNQLQQRFCQLAAVWPFENLSYCGWCWDQTVFLAVRQRHFTILHKRTNKANSSLWKDHKENCSPPHPALIFTYLGAHTGLAFLILFMGHPLIQLAPQRFGFPGGDFGLQTAVEGAAVGRVQVQLPAEDAEGLEGALTCGGLDEVLKQLPHVVLLLLRRAHRLLLQQMLRVRWGSLSARCGYTLSLTCAAMASLRRTDTEGWRRLEG